VAGPGLADAGDPGQTPAEVGEPAVGCVGGSPPRVDLVVEGLTNPQIGERLYVSRRTVQTHLAHVFNKLGISSRTQLAAEATRRQQGAGP
jgi:Bacterial regulatory proteins, luxR family